MPETDTYLHEVAITAIIVHNGKFLITRRSLTQKRFPGMWTVPGGRLEAKDYLALPKGIPSFIGTMCLSGLCGARLARRSALRLPISSM
jgi:8-oxo-dGTP pyrophosphatase MutT (NUDIX family)